MRRICCEIRRIKSSIQRGKFRKGFKCSYGKRRSMGEQQSCDREGRKKPGFPSSTKLVFKEVDF